MELEHMPLDGIFPYEDNPRQHPESQIDQIAASIEKLGFKSPILVDSAYTIVAGHGRYLAALKLGLESVPVINLGELSEQDRIAYTIADNRLAERSTWNMDVLKSEVAKLREFEFDLSLTGFEIDTLPGHFEPKLDPKAVGRQVTDKDIERAGTRMQAGGRAQEFTQVICPHCGEEFEYTGS
jgi:ParB-like chromosome segregation protein Spo0J